MLEKGLRLLAHRGPDDQGVWQDSGPWGSVGLGHRRLSILDLSPAGHQPMLLGKAAIIFNGEIYNYRELAQSITSRGVTLRSGSDTEVLLHGLKLEGWSFVRKLRGMYAFAYWDSEERRLWVARDPFGKKPLLIHRDAEGTLWLSSELRALARSGIVHRPRINASALPFFYEAGAFPQPESAVEGVSWLAPGAIVEYALEGGRIVERTLDRIDPMKPDGTSPPLREAVIRAVERRFISDRPVGVLLSGGIDSALIAGIARRELDYDVHTFTLTFGKRIQAYDESEGAAAWSRRFGTEHHELELQNPPDADELDQFCSAIDQPSADGLNTYLIAREAKKHVTVLLSGVGADELFGGYHLFTYLQKLKPLLLHPLRHRSATRELFRARTPKAYWGALLDWALTGTPKAEELYSALRGIERLPGKPSALLELSAASRESERDLINALRKIYCREYLLNTLLRDADAVTMAHAIELRSPFLDLDVARASHAVPARAHIAGTVNKPLLRSEFSDLIPTEHGKLKKKGFVLPLGAWCREAGITRKMRAREWRSGSWVTEYVGAGLLDRWLDEVESADTAVQRNYRTWTRVWQTYVLDTWARSTGVDGP